MEKEQVIRLAALSLLLAIASSVGGSQVCRANGPEVGRNAGQLFPVAADSVQLVSEYVTLRLPEPFGGDGEASCTYYFQNLTSRRQEFEMAFVTRLEGNPEDVSSRDEYERFSFNATLDNAPLEVGFSAVETDKWLDFMPSTIDSLPVLTITLEPNAAARLELVYEIEWSGGSDGGNSSFGIEYFARPAALWAGKIAKAQISFEFGPLATLMLECNPQMGSCFQYSIKPEGYEWGAQGAYWNFEDWEPTEDFSFRFEINRDEP